MTINLITFASILHKQVTIRSSHEAVLSELEKYFTLHAPAAQPGRDFKRRRQGVLHSVGQNNGRAGERFKALHEE